MSSDAPVLEGEGLAAMRGERLIFADVDFRAGPGELLTLTGRNGAGKSTLMRMIAGLVRPFAGEVRWRGERTLSDRDAFSAEFVYSGHQDGLKTALTAAGNLDLWAGLTGAGRDRVAPALERFGIADLADLPVGYMSAGQRRRVALGRLLLGGQPLWLLDEPLTAIDRATVDVLGGVMREHLDAGGLIVAATHAPLPGVEGQVLEITPPELQPDWFDDDDAFEAV
ncbi:MAG: heme ABC exporter ATP-binding protein CcmA [Minwuia sp.]|uniref:heme ABC exporter ATP-binding protein CcmA n=1 Tax=Minwuia sp. TaxID=2493630 RepID=UPI003A8A3227